MLASGDPRVIIADTVDRERQRDEDRRSAFRELADEQLTDAYGLAFAVLRDRSQAQDAVHDAFVTAWQRYETLRDPARFAPWFRRILVNTCRNRLKASSRRRTTALDTQQELATADSSSAVVDRTMVAAAIAGLKPDDRVVLALRYYRDLRIGDIAAVLDIPPNTVTSRLHRAHQRLRSALEDIDAKDVRDG